MHGPIRVVLSPIQIRHPTMRMRASATHVSASKNSPKLCAKANKNADDVFGDSKPAALEYMTVADEHCEIMLEECIKGETIDPHGSGND